MAATAGTRKRKRATARGGARSTAAGRKKPAAAAGKKRAWIEVPSAAGSHAPCCCWCVVTTPYRGCGLVAAADPAPMSRAASPEYKPSSHYAEQDYTPRTPWNSPASPSPDHATSIPAAGYALSSRAASPDPTPPTPWNSPAEPDYTPRAPWNNPASPSPGHATSIPAVEYSLSSRAASPDPTPPTPWNSPASPDRDHTPSTPSDLGYTTLTPSSHTASPDHTPSTPSSRAASLGYMPASLYSLGSSPADHTPSTPPQSPKSSDAESRSSRCPPRVTRVSRRGCLHTKTYRAFFSPRTSVV